MFLNPISSQCMKNPLKGYKVSNLGDVQAAQNVANQEYSKAQRQNYFKAVTEFIYEQPSSVSFKCNYPLDGCCSNHNGELSIGYTPDGTVIPATINSRVVCNDRQLSPTCYCYAN